MKILSLETENTDILSHIIQQVDQHIQETLRKKVVLIISPLTIEDTIIPSKTIKNLKGPVFEFRISIPGTKNLLRIIFYHQRGELILLSGYIIKPENYTDKKTTHTIKHEYLKEIAKAQKVYQDYSGPQKLSYIPITFK